MSGLVHDLKHFVRQLRSRPAGSAAIIAVLALGVSANTAMFSGFDAWVLRPLPFPEPDRLLFLHECQPRVGRWDVNVSPRNLRDWLDRQSSFREVGAFSRDLFNLEDEEEPARLQGARVDAALFPLLGVEPILGRGFVAGEDLPGQPASVALVSHRLWEQRFAGSQEVQGRTLRLEGRMYEIVGVMPEGFRFPEWAEIWTPLGVDADASPRDSRWLDVIGRLDAGVTPAQAQAELAGIAAELERLHPESNTGWSAHLHPLRDEWVPAVIDVALSASMGAGLLVLLVICANVASLMLAQVTARSRELALRTALGASRWRLGRQMLVESSLLGILAGFLGGLVGAVWLDWMLEWAPIDPPYFFAMRLDLRGWLFTMVVALFAGAVCAVAPVIRASGMRIYDELRSGARDIGGSLRAARLRAILVVGELALSTALLIGALLMVKSFVRQQAIDPGYRTEGLVTMELTLEGTRFEEPADRVRFLERLQEGLTGGGGVESVVATSRLPASDGYTPVDLEAEGQPAEPGEGQRAGLFAVTPGYFGTLEIPILDGRDFTAGEGSEPSRVAIVSASLAHRLWGGERALGRRLRDLRGGAAPWLRVVGVVEETSGARDMVVQENVPDVQLYVPYSASPGPHLTLVVASDREPAFLARRAREEVRRAGVLLPTSEVLTMREAIYRVQWVTRMFSEQLALYAIIALAIAAVGIYGLIADSVSRRGHEIAVRLAMGAGSEDVLRLVVGQGMKLALSGVVLGLGLSLATTRFGASMLLEVSPRDPIVFGLVALVLALTSLAASYLPARRAAGIDPAHLLRSE